jgi:hypothetical protein
MKFILTSFVLYNGFSFFQKIILNFSSIFYVWKYDELFTINFFNFNYIKKLTSYLQLFLSLQFEHHQHFQFSIIFSIRLHRLK